MSVLLLQIYTDWANHYLAKSGCPRLIKDLSQDVTDGVLLAQIIQIIGTDAYTYLMCVQLFCMNPMSVQRRIKTTDPLASGIT